MVLLRFIGWVFGIGTLFLLAGAAAAGVYISSVWDDLPDFQVLRDYEPPVVSRIHASDGQLVAEYYSQNRLFLPIEMMPDILKEAYISAEDRNFYHHYGFDPMAFARAMFTNLTTNLSDGSRWIGASTITQQVAKNFLVGDEYTPDRKLRELILSFRIEQAFTKDQILELYMNHNNLGLGAYGVAAAALIYFDKSVDELTLDEVAYLAALPKAPNNYNPFTHEDRAIERRNWVIDRMVENGYVTYAEGEAAKAEPLASKVVDRDTSPSTFGADYFVEEVRRQLYDTYGAQGLYEEGLSVRTSLDLEMQLQAREALMSGLIDFDQRHGWRGPVETIDLAAVEGGDWGVPLGEVHALDDVPEWRLAVVLSADNDEAQIGLQPGREPGGRLSADRQTATISAGNMSWARRSGQGVDDVLHPGDVVYVERQGSGAYALRQIPEVSGAIVAMDPYTGRVRALVGGFSYDLSEFNRATQALRQPGSSFKPFVYAAALDNGYTPATVVVDGPVSIPQGPGLPPWQPSNYENRFFGPQTLRTGVEHSYNAMTARLAYEMVGMPLIGEYARRFGIYDQVSTAPSMALGARETTVLRLTTAYAILANGGRRVEPSLIDRIQNRYGQTRYQQDQRLCEDCDEASYSGQAVPQLIDEREQVLDPMTAFQITSILEGVIDRGTASVLRGLPGDIAGKTGTTNEGRDAWFVGYSPSLVVGVFIGYDEPRSLGGTATGGALAAPVFGDFMQSVLAGQPEQHFTAPEGITFLPVNRITGQPGNPGDPNVIMEAFKPGTGPGSDVFFGTQPTTPFGDPFVAQAPVDALGNPVVPTTPALGTGTGGLF